jgi:hypothetical protein
MHLPPICAQEIPLAPGSQCAQGTFAPLREGTCTGTASVQRNPPFGRIICAPGGERCRRPFGAVGFPLHPPRSCGGQPFPPTWGPDLGAQSWWCMWSWCTLPPLGAVGAASPPFVHNPSWCIPRQYPAEPMVCAPGSQSRRDLGAPSLPLVRRGESRGAHEIICPPSALNPAECRSKMCTNWPPLAPPPQCRRQECGGGPCTVVGAALVKWCT